MDIPLIAFHDSITWSIIYPYTSTHANCKHEPFPVVSCPVVDLTGVPDNVAFEILTKFGVRYPGELRDVAGLVVALEKAGAVVKFPVEVETAKVEVTA